VLVLAVGAVVVFLVLVAALQGDAATTLVVGVLAVVAWAAWWRRNSAAAGSALSLAVALWCTSELTEWAGTVNPQLSPLQTGLVLWLFAFVVVGVVWLVPARGRHRGVTTALGEVPVVVAALCTPLAAAVAPIAGLAVAMGVVAWRSRRGSAGDARAAAGAGSRSGSGSGSAGGHAGDVRGVGRTREVLAAGIPDGWRLFEPMARDGTSPPVELLLVGPAGIYVVEPRAWPGAVALVSATVEGAVETQAYGLDDDARELAARLRPVAAKVDHVATTLDVDVAHVFGVVVFWGDGTSLPSDIVEVAMPAAGPREDQHVRMYLIRGELLVGWLLARPPSIGRRDVRRLVRAVESAFA
jgi:hypothetical protein